MKISLVVATLGRTVELREFLASLEAQSYRAFEVILIDQNPDDRLQPIVAEFAGRFPVQHLRSDVKNLSHARNLGIACASGDIVGFPDDDCLYAGQVLAQVIGHFTADPGLALVSGPAVSPRGGFGSGRWTQHTGPITLSNVFTSVISFTFFVRLEVLRAIGGFDENLGLGSPFGSGEESDVAIRVLLAQQRGFYDLSMTVLHPDKRLTPEAALRAYDYGTGMGRVLRKNSMSPRITVPYFIRPIGGVLLSLARGRTMHATYYWQTLRGRVAGFLAAPR